MLVGPHRYRSDKALVFVQLKEVTPVVIAPATERPGPVGGEGFAGPVLEDCRARQADRRHVKFPSPKYREDPVGFFREILGIDPWSRQIKVIEAVRDHARVAVRSGHKVGKSNTAAGLALWFYCSFDDARAVMTSTTSRQVDQILWRELKMLRTRGGRCVACREDDPEGLVIERPCPHSALVDGEIGELARTGLKSADFREIVGFTAREAEAVAGVSGKNLLYLVDEASGVDDAIFEAIEGNRAGGARVVLFGNPTRNSGEHFEAFHSKSELYHTITISSTESPNVTQGRIVVPGLATRGWIEEKKIEWGEDSALFKVRALGEHALHEDGKIFSIATITEAEQRWHETAEAGRLFIGFDPAGESGTGDEAVLTSRRGLRMLQIVTFRGQDEQGHLVRLLAFLDVQKLPRETPVVVLDREGAVGAKVYVHLLAHLETHPHAFELVAVRASDRAVRQPIVYDRMRDELTANFEQWLRDGGAILEDTKLEKEMHELEWKQHVNGRLKVTPKDELRKKLGRSPDRYDATVLCAWEPLSLQDGLTDAEKHAARDRRDEQDDVALSEETFDPYAGMQ